MKDKFKLILISMCLFISSDIFCYAHWIRNLGREKKPVRAKFHMLGVPAWEWCNDTVPVFDQKKADRGEHQDLDCNTAMKNCVLGIYIYDETGEVELAHVEGWGPLAHCENMGITYFGGPHGISY